MTIFTPPPALSLTIHPSADVCTEDRPTEQLECYVLCATMNVINCIYLNIISDNHLGFRADLTDMSSMVWRIVC